MDRRLFGQLMAFGAGAISFRGGRNNQQVAAAMDRPMSPQPVTVADFIPLAKSHLPKATFEYITAGSEDEVTLRDNVEAFRRMRLLPPLLHGVGAANLATKVLGRNISLPILAAPVAGLRMYHPQGALAAARGAAQAGTIFIASTSAHHSVEEIAAASEGPKWFQLYVPRQREIAKKLVRRAERAGYLAIVVTVDLGERKDADLRNQFAPPKEILLKHLRDVGHTHLDERISYQELLDFNAQAWELSLSVEFFKWLRDITRLPILLKGVLSPEAALQAVSLGLDGIVVSNHGGRRLDGMPASIDVLKNVVDEVKGKVEILLDSGVRRGGDVLKALALGASAVLIGRPLAWSLAAGGEAGVARVFEILREELLNAMIASGCATTSDIKPTLIMKS